IQDLPRLWPGSETARTRESRPEIVTREPRFLGREVISLLSAAQRATAMVPFHNLKATAEPRPMSRVALAVLLPTVALIVVGIFAYYIYPRSGLVSRPTRPMPNIGVPASPAPSASLGTGSVAAIGTTKPAAPIEPSTAVTTAPAGQGTAVVAGSNGAARQTPPPNEPHLRVSTSDQATP